MEQIKKKKRTKRTSLKKSFARAMSITVFLIVVLSGITIYGCVYIQKQILPNSNSVYLTAEFSYPSGRRVLQVAELEINGKQRMGYPTVGTPKYNLEGNEYESPYRYDYSIDKIENSYEKLSERDKNIYMCSVVSMIALPTIYSIIGIMLCALWFYKSKLNKPIKILAGAAERIESQDLDFSVEYKSNDEMGRLCDSFERMRKALYENNRQLWDIINERKVLQASVAHDLRNPIAIIEGYAEYMQLNLENGKLDNEQLIRIASNLSCSAKRLERYTDSIRDLNRIEEMEIHKKETDTSEFVNEIAEDVVMMADKNAIIVQIINLIPKCNVMLDTEILCRVIENLVSNAIRYSQRLIKIEFALENKEMTIKISDDGPGFPEKLLKTKDRYVFFEDKSGEHMGMGLVISNILCKKHGGELYIENVMPKGACATCIVRID